MNSLTRIGVTFIMAIAVAVLGHLSLVRVAEAGELVSPQITADAAVLMDALTGQVLYERNGEERRPPASTTKIMTVFLALEGGDLKREVTVSPRAALEEGASMGLRPGEKLTLEELIYGAMLCSGNDACVAIAEHIAGSEENFVLMMNSKAKLIGARNTQFKNTNGLPEKGHYSTARDLAEIARSALKNPIFRRVVSTKTRASGERFLGNTNRLLWSYAWADGVKTGTTGEAGNCLVASATRDGRQLISVVLHSDDRWSDSVKLLEYGFNSFEYLRLAEKGQPFASIPVEEGLENVIDAVANGDLIVAVPKGRQDLCVVKTETVSKLTAPVQPGQVVGSLMVFVDGNQAGTCSLITTRNVNKKFWYRLFMR